MNQRKLRKPAHLDEKTWEQHLQWMEVMGKQVEANLSRHIARVREDASRCEELLERHRKVLEAAPRRRGLYPKRPYRPARDGD